MARVEIAAEVVDDLDGIVGHLKQHGASRIGDRVAGLIDAIAISTHRPSTGRRVRHDLRVLIVVLKSDPRTAPSTGPLSALDASCTVPFSRAWVGRSKP